MRKLASPLAREHAHRKVLVDNTDRLARIVYRLGSYGRLSAHMLRHGVQPIDIIRTQFPLIRPNPTRPVLFTIELTNHCNLRCNYCTNRLGLRERGFMTEETFARVVDGIRRLGINRVRVVGGGEPTLHPTFGAFLRKAAQATHYLSVLSNGQWRHPLRTLPEMLDAPVDLIEVSVEGTDGDRYKASTEKGNFERLLENLSILKRERLELKSRSIVNLRIMVRPSDAGREHRLKAFWKAYGDTTMLQRLVERGSIVTADDLFRSKRVEDQSYPVCSLPFKAMEVNWNGNASVLQLDHTIRPSRLHTG